MTRILAIAANRLLLASTGLRTSHSVSSHRGTVSVLLTVIVTVVMYVRMC